MPAEPHDYAEVIAEGAATVSRPPLWHPTRWVAGVMLTVDVLAGRRRIHVHEPEHHTDDTNEPYGYTSRGAGLLRRHIRGNVVWSPERGWHDGPAVGIDDIDDDEAEDIRRTDQARAIALAESTYFGGIS